MEQGGHDIPKDVILRRYHRSIKNFLIDYTKIANNWMLYDNSEKHSELIAYKISGSAIDIVDRQIWQLINGGLQDVNS